MGFEAWLRTAVSLWRKRPWLGSTIGGTILGTSRDKPHKMIIHGAQRDMTREIVKTYKSTGWMRWYACGGGTKERAQGSPKLACMSSTPAKTIDMMSHDDASFGFDTAWELQLRRSIGSIALPIVTTES